MALNKVVVNCNSGEIRQLELSTSEEAQLMERRDENRQRKQAGEAEREEGRANLKSGLEKLLDGQQVSSVERAAVINHILPEIKNPDNLEVS